MRNALTLVELTVLVASMYGDNVLSSKDPELIKNATAKVLNKIGLMITVRGQYVDKLPELDGPELPLGKTIEEYFMELPKVLEEDRDGSEDGKPADPSFLKAYYSYSLPKKRIKITKRYDEYEEACYTREQFLDFIAEIEASLSESTTVFRYNLKRELIGKGISLIESIIDGDDGDDTIDGGTVDEYAPASAASLEQGDYVINPSNSSQHGIVLAPKGEIANNTTWAQAVAAGKIAVYDLAKDIAKPTGTQNGEAFIKQVLDDVEIASDNSQGHSLNGAAIGAVENLRLFTLFGVKSVVGVDVKAGAFHRDELDLGAEMRPLPNFGSYNGRTWAVLCDVRTFALFLGYQSVRVRENADGDFINFIRHMRNTPFMSRATFVKLYREPQE